MIRSSQRNSLRGLAYFALLYFHLPIEEEHEPCGTCTIGQYCACIYAIRRQAAALDESHLEISLGLFWTVSAVCLEITTTYLSARRKLAVMAKNCSNTKTQRILPPIKKRRGWSLLEVPRRWLGDSQAVLQKNMEVGTAFRALNLAHIPGSMNMPLSTAITVAACGGDKLIVSKNSE